ncbi:MAG: FimB/Mfa2 family fimbrial subunit, partial [Bacteroidales bacterium]|nr:FimB/Mfa2 family fimbrial subunit [Bacteroidales bacterium]
MKPLKSIILPLLALLLSSCNGMIYDHEGDCSYKVRFKYDYNLKWADAFPAEVTGVTLYILDSNGSIVKQIHEQGDALKADGYEMTIDALNPGT